jgi:hypothetical protein
MAGNMDAAINVATHLLMCFPKLSGSDAQSSLMNSSVRGTVSLILVEQNQKDGKINSSCG